MSYTDLLPAKKFLFFILTICLGVASFLIFPPYSMDDSYITYRYAYNLYQHNQFAFNLGERILGTTSPLYTLILTGTQIFSDNIPRMSNLISCISAALAGFLLFLILRKENTSVGILCALCFPFILQDIGLETNVLIFLFTLSMYLFDREKFLSSSIILGLCFLTRQDSAIFIVCMIIIYRLQLKKLPWREFIVFIVIVAPWFIFSYFYFGSLFPTSLGAKKGHAPFFDYFIDTLFFLVRYCDRYNFYLFSFVSGKLTALLPASYAASKQAAQYSLLLLYLPLMLFGILNHLKNSGKYNGLRLLFFIYPLLMIIALSFIAPPPTHRWHLTSAVNFALIGQLLLFTTPLLSAIKKKRASSSLNTLFKIFLTVVLVFYVLFFFISNVNNFYIMSKNADKSFWLGARFHNYKNIGLFLRDTVSDQDTIFAVEVGTIGYYSKRRMIDGAGLISPGYDRFHRKGRWIMGIEKEFPDYIVAHEMVIPYYEPIFNFANQFGKKVVFKKSQFLPEDNYPFAQLLENWKMLNESAGNRKN